VAEAASRARVVLRIAAARRCARCIGTRLQRTELDRLNRALTLIGRWPRLRLNPGCAWASCSAAARARAVHEDRRRRREDPSDRCSEWIANAVA